MPQGHDHLPSLRRAALVSLGVGIVLLVAKWVAYWLTGSHAILSDALESIVNVVASGFALLSVLLSARPPDPKYPYGYGKITYFSAGFEGGMIALAACAILYEAVQGLVYGQELRRLDHGLIIMGAASVVNFALGLWLLRLSRQTDSLVLKAEGRHVVADAYTSTGVVVGVGLVLMTGWRWLDGAVAILVGLNVLWTGYSLVREAFVGLMDRADPDVLAKIVAALQNVRQPGWIDLHQLRCWQAGDRTFVDFHLVVPDHWTVADVHDAHVLCRETLRQVLGDATEMIIHFDPDPRARTVAEHQRRWTVEQAVRVPAEGELGSEATSPNPMDAVIK
ncbi:MAG TPA: cation diffusion facilitator family transporter [Isosphaeraceae bacterium]|jgi:cation diffusion facilitator family transporter|nr:cation diffusion facilitator family transporter [Isosphaeraceae bacterium]